MLDLLSPWKAEFSWEIMRLSSGSADAFCSAWHRLGSVNRGRAGVTVRPDGVYGGRRPWAEQLLWVSLGHPCLWLGRVICLYWRLCPLSRTQGTSCGKNWVQLERYHTPSVRLSVCLWRTILTTFLNRLCTLWQNTFCSYGTQKRDVNCLTRQLGILVLFVPPGHVWFSLIIASNADY